MVQGESARGADHKIYMGSYGTKTIFYHYFNNFLLFLHSLLTLEGKTAFYEVYYIGKLTNQKFLKT